MRRFLMVVACLVLVARVGVAAFHGAALSSVVRSATATTSVVAWGSGNSNALGDGTNITDSSHVALVPSQVQIPSGTIVTQVVQDSGGGFALTSTGTVLRWGCCDDTNTAYLTTVLMNTAANGSFPAGTVVTKMASTYQPSQGPVHGNVFFITNNGLFALGRNSFGQLGNGTVLPPTAATTPQKAVFPSGTTIVSASPAEVFSLAVDSNGGVWSWGHNSVGELGDGTTTDHLVPTVMTGFPSGTKIVAVAGEGTATGANTEHSLALSSTGQVFAWGDNQSGELGDGTTTQRDTPVPVAGLPSHIVAITANIYSSYALDSTGKVWAWGDNSNGGELGAELSPFTVLKSTSPVQVNLPVGTVVTQIAAGAADTISVSPQAYALTDTGKVFSWGWGHGRVNVIGNGMGLDTSLGGTNLYSSPVQVLVSGATSISGTGDAGFAIGSISPGPAVFTGPGTDGIDFILPPADGTAQLVGKVDPRSQSTVSDCHFNVGLTIAYTQTAPCLQTVGSGSGFIDVTADLTGLAPNTTYHYQLQATNAGDTILGEDRTFTTPNFVPGNTTPPSISGTGAVGQTLTCNPGVWTGSPTSFTYEFLRDGQPIGTFSSTSTYMVQAADQVHTITCQVIGHNGAGDSTAVPSTNGIAVAATSGPVNNVPPTISGRNTVRSTLTCNTRSADWSGSPTFTYEFLEGTAVVSGPRTSNTYHVLRRDAGKTISCVVIGTNPSGHVSAPSSNSITIAVRR